MADIAHISGLIIAKCMSSPFEHCDVVTMTTHKTLRGPRGALIFYRKNKIGDNLEEKINFAVFPMLQGGPHNNTIAAIAVALKQASTPEYTSYIKRVRENARSLADALIKLDYKILTGGTDCHLILIDISNKGITGGKVEKACEAVIITINKNSLPGSSSPLNPKGVRLGTSALTTRGFKEEDMRKVASLFDECVALAREINSICMKEGKKKVTDFIKRYKCDQRVIELGERVRKFASSFPIPYFDYLIK
jgi:glycine hydroxymethyltransferase